MADRKRPISFRGGISKDAKRRRVDGADGAAPKQALVLSDAVAASEKSVVLTVGIPGVRKEALVEKMAEIAGKKVSSWKMAESTHDATEFVILLQDNFEKNKEACMSAMLKALSTDGVKYVFVARNNFTRADREPWIQTALKATPRIYLMYPASLFQTYYTAETGSDLEAAASFIRCVDHTIAKSKDAAHADSPLAKLVPTAGAYLVASFYNKRETPLLRECSGLVPFDMIDTSKVHAAVAASAGLAEELRKADKLARSILPFHGDDTVTVDSSGSFTYQAAGTGAEAKGQPWKKKAKSGDKSSQKAAAAPAREPPEGDGAVQKQAHLLMQPVVALTSQMADDVDIPLEKTAAQAWERLSSLAPPVPIYYALLPSCAASQEVAQKIRAALRTHYSYDVPTSLEQSALKDVHVTLLYLAKQAPSKDVDAKKFDAFEQLQALASKGHRCRVKMGRLVTSSEMAVVEAILESDASIPCQNVVPYILLGMKPAATVGDSPLRPVHAKDLLVEAGVATRQGDGANAKAFHDVKVHVPSEDAQALEVDFAVRPVFFMQ